MGIHFFMGDSTSPMPEWWEECTDRTSGRKYYYNHQTGQSQWNRPTKNGSNNNNNNNNFNSNNNLTPGGNNNDGNITPIPPKRKNTKNRTIQQKIPHQHLNNNNNIGNHNNNIGNNNNNIGNNNKNNISPHNNPSSNNNMKSNETISSSTTNNSMGMELSLSPPVFDQHIKLPSCSNCDNDFTFFNRRHHCRCCSREFCGDCTKYSSKRSNKKIEGIENNIIK